MSISIKTIFRLQSVQGTILMIHTLNYLLLLLFIVETSIETSIEISIELRQIYT